MEPICFASRICKYFDQKPEIFGEHSIVSISHECSALVKICCDLYSRHLKMRDEKLQPSRFPSMNKTLSSYFLRIQIGIGEFMECFLWSRAITRIFLYFQFFSDRPTQEFWKQIRAPSFQIGVALATLKFFKAYVNSLGNYTGSEGQGITLIIHVPASSCSSHPLDTLGIRFFSATATLVFSDTAKNVCTCVASAI